METWKFNRNIANVRQEIFGIFFCCIWAQLYRMNNGMLDWRDYFLYIIHTRMHYLDSVWLVAGD